MPINRRYGRQIISNVLDRVQTHSARPLDEWESIDFRGCVLAGGNLSRADANESRRVFTQNQHCQVQCHRFRPERHPGSPTWIGSFHSLTRPRFYLGHGVRIKLTHCLLPVSVVDLTPRRSCQFPFPLRTSVPPPPSRHVLRPRPRSSRPGTFREKSTGSPACSAPAASADLSTGPPSSSRA